MIMFKLKGHRTGVREIHKRIKMKSGTLLGLSLLLVIGMAAPARAAELARLR